MLPTLFLIVLGISDVTAGLTAILARDQVDEAQLREEPKLAEMIGKDTRRLPDRVFTAKGVRFREVSNLATLVGVAALVGYTVVR